MFREWVTKHLPFPVIIYLHWLIAFGVLTLMMTLILQLDANRTVLIPPVAALIYTFGFLRGIRRTVREVIDSTIEKTIEARIMEDYEKSRQNEDKKP